jgi:uncharacterized protein (DUF924 family)
MPAQPADVVEFWRQAGSDRWFEKDAAFDEAIRLKYEGAHHAAARGEHDAWIETAEGALALVILLDQFPRNLYRGSGHAFATDPKARRIAGDAIERGCHRAVAADFRQFFYLPFEHSEHLEDQDHGVALCAKSGDADLVKWATIHRDIITRFGRFPHRNASLGRATTEAEQAFLKDGGFSG